MKILVTGGAGFIGSAVCRHLVAIKNVSVVNVDKLTYAANPRSLDSIANDARYAFQQADICDRATMDAIFAHHKPTAVIHLAAESHVDRSITGADAFLETNIVGTYRLLEATKSYHAALEPDVAVALSFCPCINGRSLRLARSNGALPRGYTLSAKLALFGEQSSIRSSSARMVQDLWTTGYCIELFEQLRAVPVPRKAYPANDFECSRWQIVACLRQGHQRPRLAACRRSCARTNYAARAWRAG